MLVQILLLIYNFQEESPLSRFICICLWCFVVRKVKEDNIINLLITMKSLLDAYVDVFEEPKGLLPMWAFHHSIEFVPGSTLPN